MINFAIIGAAGFVAPRHMQAIKETSNKLVAAFDPNDSVGVIDKYFPEADFFTEFERFDRHLELLKINEGVSIDFVAVTSPNYLHDSHCRFAMRSGSNAICEKPIALNPWNVDSLMQAEEMSEKRTYSILQLRLHPRVKELKKMVEASANDRKFEIDLTYITARGKWYLQSWKGDEKKAGGVATNIGVHFFDMLNYVFGAVQRNEVHYRDDKKSSGFLEFENARVRWLLSIDSSDLPSQVTDNGQTTYRSLTLDGVEFEFSSGFGDLHTESYKHILAGNGFGLLDARPAIQIVSDLRSAPIVSTSVDRHPFLQKT